MSETDVSEVGVVGIYPRVIGDDGVSLSSESLRYFFIICYGNINFIILATTTLEWVGRESI